MFSRAALLHPLGFRVALGLLTLVASTQTPSAPIAAVGNEIAAPPVVTGATTEGASACDEPEALSATDWSSIRAVHEAHRHAVAAAADGHRARNDTQQLLARFDGRGFSVHPDAGDWQWGLQFERYGFAGEERLAVAPAQVCAAGKRVTYDWDAGLQEWYVNDHRGLEHGFTIREQPPKCEEGPLRFVWSVRGDLAAQVSSDGLSVAFATRDGIPALTYSELAVTDADGFALPARFEATAADLLLSIDEQDAHYPLTIDPLVQQAYLKASNTGVNDGFGQAVAISGNTVVIGAFSEDSDAVGINGDQSSNAAPHSGAAYVFVRSGSLWSQEAYLKASNSGSADHFGVDVAISGDTIVVGAYREDSNATGVDGDETDNTSTDAGAAYVFVRSGTTWTQQAYLKASNTDAGDEFGECVSVSGDTLVTGAPGESSSATGVNGDGTNDDVIGSGAAYVFVRSGTTWSQEAYLKASTTDISDLFGHAVGVSGDTLVVGAFSEDSNATGVNGDETDNSAANSGAAYVFARVGTTWTQQAYLKASNTGANDAFGWLRSVAVSGDTVAVAAYGEDSNATGIGGGQGDNSATHAGAVYIFTRSGTTWSQQAYVKASNTDVGDEFGISVSLSGDALVVGAWREDSNATGVDGDQSNNSMFTAGAAYVFERVGTAWSQTAYLKASNTEAGDFFGVSVAVSGSTFVVGAQLEASNATGVNGDDSNNSATGSGAAYVFDVGVAPKLYCTAGTTSLGCVPSITWAGVPSVSASAGFAISVANVDGQRQGILFYGVSGRTAAPWALGSTSFLCVKAPTQRMGVQNSGGTNGACDGQLSVDWCAYVAAHPSALGSPFSAGDVVDAQAWFRDPPAPKTTNLSNALEFVVEP